MCCYRLLLGCCYSFAVVSLVVARVMLGGIWLFGCCYVIAMETRTVARMMLGER